ncbi:MAG: type III pantothenate kinase [Chthoniobacterales bacterium]|nr:type III pantothenate kinase [Chthoniobacterales bacterium]
MKPDPISQKNLFNDVGSYLLVDLSNSNSKFALATREALLEKRSIPTASLSKKNLEEITREWAPKFVIIASVVPEATQILTDFFKEATIPLFSINAQSDLGITMDYPTSASIGADCLANIVAARKFYPFPSIVIDLGTAITFDVIDAQGVYLGVIIAPGLMTSAQALHEHTALLPRIMPAPIKQIIGKNTIDAMQSGLILGAKGLIREVTTRISKEYFLGKRPTIIATGGDAKLLGEDPPLFDIINPDLTLEGIREIAGRILSLL